MFCPNCAQPISDGAKFCAYCGFPIESAQVSTAAAPAQPAQDQPAAPTYQQPVQEQPTTVYPQPAQTQAMPTYQQVPVAQQAPVYTQEVPAVQTAKKSSPVAKIVLTVLGVALAFGIGFLFRKGFTALFDRIFGGSTDTSTPIEVPTIEPLPTIDVDDIIEDIDIDNFLYVDGNGNPKLFALMNLDGEALADALEDAEWHYDEEFVGWISEKDNLFFVNGMDDYEYTEEEIRSMEAGGGNEVAIMISRLFDTDYDSMDDVVESIVGTSIVDRTGDDSSTYLIVRSIGLKDYFVHIFHDEDMGSYNVFFCNDAAITSGYVEDYLGVQGTAIEDLWYDLTGEEIGE